MEKKMFEMKSGTVGDNSKRLAKAMLEAYGFDNAAYVQVVLEFAAKEAKDFQVEMDKHAEALKAKQFNGVVE